MSEQTDRLTELLINLGLTDEESKLYLYLVKNGANTALKISRDLHLARTKVYRILDTLYGKRLVNQKLEGRGLKFETESFRNLDLLVKDQENKLNGLKNNLPILFEELNRISRTSSFSSKILYYEGVEGLKQVTWNSLKAQSELRIFEIATMSQFLDFGFCEEVRQEFVNRKVHVRELCNQKKIAGWTNVTEFPKKYWQCRYLDPKKLAMKFEILIYNEVVCFYNYENEHIFCAEIYDSRLAEMQKQMFDFLWDSARKMRIVNENGEAVVM